jgi:PKD repeat protein
MQSKIVRAALTQVAVLLLSAGALCAEPVVWTNVVKSSVTATNLLTKTGTNANAWDAGATSTKGFDSGDGYAEFTVAETTTARMFGLSRGDADQSFGDIDYGIIAWSGSFEVWEGGAWRGNFGSYASGNVFRVAVVGGVVKYSRNGTVFYTSTIPPHYPLSVDTSLLSPGATISNAVISAPTLIRLSNVIWGTCIGTMPCLGTTTGANSIMKGATTFAWDSGGIATQVLSSGDGFLEFSAQQTNTAVLAGFGDGSTTYDKSHVQFGIRLDSNGQMAAMENGSQIGTSIGTYVAGDRFRVEVQNGTVRYRKNGAQMYVSQNAPTFPLIVQACLFNQGGMIKDAVIGGTNITGSPIEDVVGWQNVVRATANGNTLTRAAAYDAWDGGASSTRTIASGDGFIEMTATETSTHRFFGLSRTDPTQGGEMNYAFYVVAGGGLYIYENTAQKAGVGGYVAGDRLRIEVSGGVVRYRRNGALLYTSTLPPTYPLLVDTSLFSQNGTVASVVISGNLVTDLPPVANAGGPYYTWPNTTLGFNGSASTDDLGIAGYSWNFGDGGTASGAQAIHAYATAGTYTASLTVTDTGGHATTANATVTVGTALTVANVVWAQPIGVTISTNTITKNGGSNIWDAGAASTKVIGSGDGFVEWTALEGNTRRACGFGNALTDTDASTGDIKFGLWADEAHNLYAVESGIQRGPLGTYVGGDRLRVAVEGGTVRYRKNGYLVGTYAGPAPTYPLRVDASLWSPGAAVTNAVIGYPGNVVPTASAGTGYYAWPNTVLMFDGSGSYDPDGTIVTYSWNFGDGTTGTGVRPQHTYTTAGNRTVTLTVTDDSGASASASAAVTIAAARTVTNVVWTQLTGPVAFIAPSGIYKVGTTTVSDSGGVSTKRILSGDGYVEFTVPGSSTRACGLGLPTTDNTLNSMIYGVEAGTNGFLDVYENGTIAVSHATTYQANDSIRVGLEGGRIRYRKNGLLFYEHVTTAPYPLAVHASITTYNGTLMNVVIARPPNMAPTANAGGNYYTWPTVPIMFNGTGSTDADGVVATYAWNFGDGTTGTGAQPSHVYAAGGTYTVSLTVTDDEGQTSTAATTSVTVAATLVQRNVVWTNLVGTTVTGDTLWRSATGGAWDAGAFSTRYIGLGDGYVEATLPDVTQRAMGLSASDTNADMTSIRWCLVATAGGTLQVYESGQIKWTGGTYVANDKIRISVEGGVIRFRKNGLFLYQSQTAVVYPLYVDASLWTAGGGTIKGAVLGTLPNQAPVARPGGAYNAVAGQALTIDGSTSSDVDGGIVSYAWNLGDGTTANTPTVAHVYWTPGSYNVTLTVTDVDGATNTASTTVNAVNLGTAQSVVWKNLVGVVANGSQLTKTLGTSWWDAGAVSGKALASGDGYLEFVATDNVSRKTVGFNNGDPDQGAHMPFEFVLDSDGKVYIYEGWMQIMMPPGYQDWGSYAAGDRFRISIQSNVVRFWKNGFLLYTSPSTPLFPLVVDTSFGNYGATISSAVISGTFAPNLAPVANAGGPYVGAPGASILLSALESNDPDGNVVSYSWDFGDGTPGISNALVDHTYASAGSYTATVTVTDDGGLTTSAQAMVTIATGVTSQFVVWTDRIYTVSWDSGWLQKATGGENWNAGAISIKSLISGDGFMEWHTYETGTDRMCGLSHVDTAGTYPGIAYAIRARADGNLEVFESGTSRGVIGPYHSGDRLRVSISGGNITYAVNGQVKMTRAATPAPVYPLYADCSLYSSGASSSMTALGGHLSNTAPVANVGGPYQAGLGQDLFFDGTLTTDDGAPLSYSWNFGDGSTALGATPRHAYTANGQYSATLTVTDPEGASSTASTTVTVGAPLTVVNVIWTNLQNVLAQGNTLIKILSSGGIFDGGAASVQQILQGNGYVEFTAVETNTSRVCGLNNNDSTVDRDDIPFAINLTDAATVQIWEWGNWRGTFGSYASGDRFRISVDAGVVRYWQNNRLLYRSANTPVFPLRVDTAMKTYGSAVTDAVLAGRFVANQAPIANAGGPYFLGAGGVVQFDGRFSGDRDGTILSYAWTFGDGTTATGPTPSHTYSGAPPFTATLTVTDNEGATGTGSATVAASSSADSDGDGVPDATDCFPFDPTQSQCLQPDANDHTPPIITLIEPAGAVVVP